MAKSSPNDQFVSVRMNADDVATMEWLRVFIRAQVGAGVNLSNGDVMRWALHAAKSAVELGLAERTDG